MKLDKVSKEKPTEVVTRRRWPLIWYFLILVARWERQNRQLSSSYGYWLWGFKSKSVLKALSPLHLWKKFRRSSPVIASLMDDKSLAFCSVLSLLNLESRKRKRLRWELMWHHMARWWTNCLKVRFNLLGWNGIKSRMPQAISGTMLGLIGWNQIERLPFQTNCEGFSVHASLAKNFLAEPIMKKRRCQGDASLIGEGQHGYKHGNWICVNSVDLCRDTFLGLIKL